MTRKKKRPRKQRGDWGDIKPVTRMTPTKKERQRRKERKHKKKENTKRKVGMNNVS